MADLIREILEATTFREQDIDAVLDTSKVSWINFDPELGYVPRDVVLRDGQDFALTTYTHEKAGNRRVINFAQRPCRINTYGDSYTQSQQVSDDETWQERLAAHLGEPIRNFGIGGHSILTAVHRAMRHEVTEVSAEYIVLGIFGDDHVRNLDASRWIRTQYSERDRPREKAWPQHGLPWVHLRYDLGKNKFVECPGACKTPEDLRRLCDPEHFYNTFKDDQIVRLYSLEVGGETRLDDLEKTAEALGIKVDLRDPAKRPAEAKRLRHEYGIKSTMHILDEFLPWLKQHNKKPILVLSYGPMMIRDHLKGMPLPDQPLRDYLANKGIKPIDILEKHLADYQAFKVIPGEYVQRYFITPREAAVFGHYSPLGNLFFAMAIKDEFVAHLDPKPPAYR